MYCERRLRTPVLLACCATLLPAATLEKLSMDDMVQKSTAIVRGRVMSSSAAYRGIAGRGGLIYTHYTVQVLERWKGTPANSVDVAVPGGIVQNRRQTFPGAPSLDLNAEYVLFLWTSRSGLTQIIGLSQGSAAVKIDASGAAQVSRAASSEPAVDASGNAAADSAWTMPLTAFRSKMAGYGLVDR